MATKWSEKRHALRLTPEMEDLVFAEAERRETSPATVIRSALSKHFGLAELPEYPTAKQKAKGGYWSEPWKRQRKQQVS